MKIVSPRLNGTGLTLKLLSPYLNFHNRWSNTHWPAYSFATICFICFPRWLRHLLLFTPFSRFQPAGRPFSRPPSARSSVLPCRTAPLIREHRFPYIVFFLKVSSPSVPLFFFPHRLAGPTLSIKNVWLILPPLEGFSGLSPCILF